MGVTVGMCKLQDIEVNLMHAFVVFVLKFYNGIELTGKSMYMYLYTINHFWSALELCLEVVPKKKKRSQFLIHSCLITIIEQWFSFFLFMGRMLNTIRHYRNLRHIFFLQEGEGFEKDQAEGAAEHVRELRAAGVDQTERPRQRRGWRTWRWRGFRWGPTGACAATTTDTPTATVRMLRSLGNVFVGRRGRGAGGGGVNLRWHVQAGRSRCVPVDHPPPHHHLLPRFVLVYQNAWK